MGKCLEVFNETGCKLEFYGYFEDGWNAALKYGDSTAHNIAMPKLVDELRGIISVCISELAYPKDYARAVEILNQLSA